MYHVLKYIQEHIKDDLSLTEVAARFGYSKWHFCSKFHEYTGRSFVKYLRHFRFQLAALDILEGKKIIDVATDFGYDSASGFNKAFFSEFGCYPSEYKKNAKDALMYYERRQLNMFHLSDRCAMLRGIMMNDNPYEKYYTHQHCVYTALGREEKRGEDNLTIIGGGISHLLDRFHPVIIPGELIVGFNFPEYEVEPDTIEKTAENIESMKECGITEEEIDRYFAITGSPFSNITPPKAEEREGAAKEWAAIGLCRAANHSVIGYEKVLKKGFAGILKEVEEWEEKNGSNSLYTAMKAMCQSACSMGERYAAEAKRLKESKNEEYKAEDLDSIIATCQNVPAHPAQTFREAVQALWFAHIINTWEDFINANSIGRLDQILYPYYKADIEKGILTKEEAFEIICCLWLKLYRDYDVQQSCVGGTHPDGTSAVNELSYLMLDATEQLGFVRCLSVRFSQNTEKDFLKRALEVVGHLQKGIPFFFNDDVMIPALESKGISHEDACNYTQIGCVETVIPGKSNPHAVTGLANFLKGMEYTLGNGFSLMYPTAKNGMETGPLSSFDTFEKFYAAVLKQIYHILDLVCQGVAEESKYAVHNVPRPYKALLTEGCMESGRDFNDAGALYDYYQITLGGIPNLADSLEVIRTFVYQEKKYTLAQVKEILMANYPDEAVRREFINKAPKFGNDIDSVDSLAVDILNKSCDMLEELSEKYGLSFHPQPFTFLWMLNYGEHSAASPDGRRKGEPLAYSISPMQGRDFSGLTALLNSISKFPTKRTPGTTSAIVEIDPKLFSDRNISLLTDILIASAKNGLSNIQFNTFDAETLKDAKLHPEKYNNLAVRVSGFSQKFNLLSEELQDHIIARTKHATL